MTSCRVTVLVTTYRASALSTSSVSTSCTTFSWATRAARSGSLTRSSTLFPHIKSPANPSAASWRLQTPPENLGLHPFLKAHHSQTESHKPGSLFQCGKQTDSRLPNKLFGSSFSVPSKMEETHHHRTLEDRRTPSQATGGGPPITRTEIPTFLPTHPAPSLPSLHTHAKGRT